MGERTAFPPDCALVHEVIASPNHNERARERAPDIILLHYTGMESADAALSRLIDEHAPRVSSHYLVHEDGRIVQLVPEARRAWHAGDASWEGETDINSRSIGIEIVNPGHDFGYRDFPEPQVDAVIALCRDIAARRRIRPDRILGHSDVSPLRKRDPGEKFPWDRLHRAGVGHWVAPSPIVEGPVHRLGDRDEALAALQMRLVQYGYGLSVTGEFDSETEAVITAFQRHFRPERVDGIADLSTVATLTDLLAKRPP